MVSRLALVAADVTTQSLAILPEQAKRYWIDPDGVELADFVRASMSIPFFFRPFEVNVKEEDRKSLEGWEKDGSPAKFVFVDGGILSNFPIAVFHSPGSVPTHPTFGVKLNPLRRPNQPTSTLLELAGAIFNTARHSLDDNFLKSNTEYQRLVTYVDTKGIGWLDFNMSPENKLSLFSQGVKAAMRFLDKFDWPAYKNLRHDMLQVPAVNQLRREAQQVESQLLSQDEFDLMLDGHREKVKIYRQDRYPGGFDATVVHGRPGEQRAYSRYRVHQGMIVKSYCLLTKEGAFVNFARVQLTDDNQYIREDTRLPDDDAWINEIGSHAAPAGS